ncbi:MAG: hypothetical protein WC655_09470 [Candidatus Hydrogenedentales bacterium]|jgi:hypothetical protein
MQNVWRSTRTIAGLLLCWLSIGLSAIADGGQRRSFSAADQEKTNKSFAQALAALQGDDESMAASALLQLTGDIDSLEETLPTLLEVSQHPINPSMSPRLIRDRRHLWPTRYSSFETRNALIIGCIADSIRETTDPAKRSACIAAFEPFVLEAIGGKKTGISRVEALIAYYSSAFFPNWFPVSPDSSPYLERILSTLFECLGSNDTALRSKASDLLLTAAGYLPERRVQIVQQMEDILKQAGDLALLASMQQFVTNRLTKSPVGISEKLYRSVQQKSTEDIVRYILENGSIGLLPEAEIYVVLGRPLDVKTRIQITEVILANSDYSERLWTWVVPYPILDSASDQDKSITDSVIAMIEKKRKEVTNGPLNVYWPTAAIRRMALGDADLLDVDGKLHLAQTSERPYALDRLIQKLGAQFTSGRANSSREAADVLGAVAWIDRTAAESALALLTNSRGGLIDSPKGTDNTQDTAYDQKEREVDERISFGLAEKAKQSARNALAYFDRLEEEAHGNDTGQLDGGQR